VLIGIIKFTIVLEALKEEWYVALLDNATDIVIILVLVYALLSIPRQASARRLLSTILVRNTQYFGLRCGDSTLLQVAGP